MFGAEIVNDQEIAFSDKAVQFLPHYELLFTVPIGDLEKVRQIEDVHLIGHITEEKYGHVLVSRDGNEFELKAQGWNPLQ